MNPSHELLSVVAEEDPFHLSRYVDEQAFRYNKHGGNDGSRFADVVKAITGKRLTYTDLTGAKFDFATT